PAREIVQAGRIQAPPELVTLVIPMKEIERGPAIFRVVGKELPVPELSNTSVRDDPQVAGSVPLNLCHLVIWQTVFGRVGEEFSRLIFRQPTLFRAQPESALTIFKQRAE